MSTQSEEVDLTYKNPLFDTLPTKASKIGMLL